MKQFRCSCGHAVYFESHQCIACGALLGFDPGELEMRSLTESNGFLSDEGGRRYLACKNGTEYGVCNWLRSSDDTHTLCLGCRFNRTIPDLTKPVNLVRWRKFETSKKRLLYTLLRLGLPLSNGFDDPRNGLLLDFIEDSRSDPYQFPETFSTTGYLGGIITVNALEADDAAREAMRVEMGESYRTVLGHLRHESGHYYWSLFDAGPKEIEVFNALFGDLFEDYSSALSRYYADGPREHWAAQYISAYASSHPIEDWAESWGHYLHIYDVLETAAALGVTDSQPVDFDIRQSISTWSRLSITLNELNRSIGLGDAYPFVVTAAVEEKLVYVDKVIRRLRTLQQAAAAR